MSYSLHPDPAINQTNVLGGALASCCFAPLTGFYRNGFCHTGPQDIGLHTVCAKMTREFLEFSVAKGNDLVTPLPEVGFPGLQPNDYWCVCVRYVGLKRWMQVLHHRSSLKLAMKVYWTWLIWIRCTNIVFSYSHII